MGPAKLFTWLAAMSLKNHTGSRAEYVTRAMSHSSDAMKSTTPANSLKRRDSADSANDVVLSDFHDDREHQGPPSGTLPEQPLHLEPDPFLDEAGIRSLLDRRLSDGPRQQGGCV